MRADLRPWYAELQASLDLMQRLRANEQWPLFGNGRSVKGNPPQSDLNLRAGEKMSFSLRSKLVHGRRVGTSMRRLRHCCTHITIECVFIQGAVWMDSWVGSDVRFY